MIQSQVAYLDDEGAECACDCSTGTIPISIHALACTKLRTVSCTYLVQKVMKK